MHLCKYCFERQRNQRLAEAAFESQLGKSNLIICLHEAIRQNSLEIKMCICAISRKKKEEKIIKGIAYYNKNV